MTDEQNNNTDDLLINDDPVLHKLLRSAFYIYHISIPDGAVVYPAIDSWTGMDVAFEGPAEDWQVIRECERRTGKTYSRFESLIGCRVYKVERIKG